MNSAKPKPFDSIQWLPAERLGQLSVDAVLRPWLIGKGLLTQRLRAVCGQQFSLRLIEQSTGLLGRGLQSALGVQDGAGLFRDVAMRCGEPLCVFAQTVMPDSTLCAHPWLGELGDAALGETLSALSGVERSPYEFAWLPDGEALAARALEAGAARAAGFWARRSRFALRGAPLLVHELFLPALGVAAGGQSVLVAARS